MRVGPSAPSCRAPDASTSSPSLNQRTRDPAGATSQRSSTRPGALNCRSRERAAGCTILSGGAGGRTERGRWARPLPARPLASQSSPFAEQFLGNGTTHKPWALTCARCHAKDTTVLFSATPDTPYCWLHFIDEDLKPLYRELTCPGLHGQKEVDPHSQIYLTPKHNPPYTPFPVSFPCFPSDELITT